MELDGKDGLQEWFFHSVACDAYRLMAIQTLTTFSVPVHYDESEGNPPAGTAESDALAEFLVEAG